MLKISFIAILILYFSVKEARSYGNESSDFSILAASVILCTGVGATAGYLLYYWTKDEDDSGFIDPDEAPYDNGKSFRKYVGGGAAVGFLAGILMGNKTIEERNRNSIINFDYGLHNKKIILNFPKFQYISYTNKVKMNIIQIKY